ncbi:MAG: sigma-54-dependent transcriptional regulator, partial [Spirochaetota bacterium]
MSSSTILVVDDIPQNRRILSDRLRAEGYDVCEAADGDEALDRARALRPDLVLLDILLPGIDGYEVLRRARGDEGLRHIPIVVVSAVDDLDSVARCLELGAEDYLTKPIDPVVLRARVRGCLEKKQWRDQERAYLAEIAEANTALERRVAAENACLRQEIEASRTSETMIGESPAFREVLTAAARVAPTDATVLILGETGTGKELLARAIHEMSERCDRALVTVNCSALPPSLIESELFGHERGAFTGAVAKRLGRFELADGGTIFLDEIGDLPLELQAKLLRVLQEGAFERLGGTTTITVDARVIAATNRELDRRVAEGAFREDLYYRLNVIPLRCPPLRERTDDIPLLVHHLVAKYNARVGRTASDIPADTMRRLQAYRWPGNIRELENTIERAVIP